ncbi:MAG: hypothetical protein ACM3XM_16705, partial [Mycobacterium leprae]
MLLLCFGFGVTPLKVSIWLFAGSTVSLADLFMNGVFRLYTYHPFLLPNPDKDNHLGVMIAEMLFVPASYSLMAYLPRHLRFWYTLLITLLVTSLEVLFLRIRVYEHDGWRILYTVILFAVYGTVVSTWANRFDGQGYTRLNRAVQLATSLFFPAAVWGLGMDSIVEVVATRPGWLVNPDRDLILGGYLLEGIPVIVVGLVACIYRWNRRPWQLVVMAGVLTVWFCFLRWWGVTVAHPRWNLALEALVWTLLIWGVGRLDRWFERETRNR